MPNIIITENGINKLLQNINIHKASGPDNIHGRILKECTTQIAPISTTLFSLSLKTGKNPDDWRYASVCPAFKKGDKNNPINHRSISLRDRPFILKGEVMVFFFIQKYFFGQHKS
jgi:hypothetical protein